MHDVFLSENECTVGEQEFVFDGEDSKASSTTVKFRSVSFIVIVIIIIMYPLTARVVGSSQMISQPVFSIFPLFSTALCDLANSRLVHSLMLSSQLFLCLPYLLPPFTVPCKMVLARRDEWETWPYHCSLQLFTIVRRSSCGPIACWILARTSLLVIDCVCWTDLGCVCWTDPGHVDLCDWCSLMYAAGL